MLVEFAFADFRIEGHFPNYVRNEIWHCQGCVAVVELIVFAATFSGAAMSADPEKAMAAVGPIGGLALFVFGVAAFWISLAIAIKRFHDRDKVGWWVLITLVPVIGPIWYLIECGFLRGTTGPNKYGSDPLAAG